MVEEDEKSLIERGLTEPFWAWLTDLYRRSRDQALGQVSRPDISDSERAFYSGTVATYEVLLKYPELRLKILDQKITRRTPSQASPIGR